jgi:hypothetical protein
MQGFEIKLKANIIMRNFDSVLKPTFAASQTTWALHICEVHIQTENSCLGGSISTEMYQHEMFLIQVRPSKVQSYNSGC